MTDTVHVTEDTADCAPALFHISFSFCYFNRPPFILAKADHSLFDISKFKFPDFSKNYLNFSMTTIFEFSTLQAFR